MKKFKTLVTNVMVGAYLFVVTAVMNMSLALAGETGGNTIWDKSGGAAAEFMTQFTTIYKQWFPIVGLVGLVAYFFIKDQRAKEIEKKTLIGATIVYVLCSEEVQNMVIGTIDWVAGLFS